MSLRPTFMGMETMRRAIQSAQKGLDITGGNLANIKTPGYSRQRVDYVSLNYGTKNIRYDSATSLAGQGNAITGITQIRNPILDKAFREATTDITDTGIKMDVMGSIEDLLSSVYTDGFNKTFAAVKDALQGYDNADDISHAGIFQGTIKNMITSLHVYSSELKKQNENLHSDMVSDVKDVNSILKEIAALNKQITNGYIQGGDYNYENGNFEVNNTYGPLELKDTRNLLLDSLAAHGNINVTEQADGTVDVTFAGELVVSGDTYSQLKVQNHGSGATQLLVTDRFGQNPKDISAYNGSLTGGSMRGYLDMLNGGGLYGNSVDLAKTNTETQLKEINDILDQVKTINENVNLSPTEKTKQLEAAEKELQKYGDEFSIDTDGIVKIGDSELTGTDADGKAWASKLYATTDKDNSGFTLQYADKSGKLQDAGTIADPVNTLTPTQINDAIKKVSDLFDDATLSDADKKTAMEAAMKDITAICPDFELKFDANDKLQSLEFKGTTLVDDSGAGVQDTVDTITQDVDKNTIITLASGTSETYPHVPAQKIGMSYANPTADTALLGKGSLTAAIEGAHEGEIYSTAKGIPYYQKVVDALANTIANEMNLANSLTADKIHLKDKEGNILLRPLFVTSDGAAEFTAENLAISKEWLDDPMLHTRPVVGVYDTNGDCTGVTSDPLLNEETKDALMKGAIQNLTHVLTAKKLFWTIDSSAVDQNKKTGLIVTKDQNDNTNCTVDGFISFYNNDVNEQIAKYESAYSVYEVSQNQLANRRDSYMGVSFDEEGTNMMEFQKWYNAAARVMTAMDEALDTIINRMGRVGL